MRKKKVRYHACKTYLSHSFIIWHRALWFISTYGQRNHCMWKKSNYLTRIFIIEKLWVSYIIRPLWQLKCYHLNMYISNYAAEVSLISTLKGIDQELILLPPCLLGSVESTGAHKSIIKSIHELSLSFHAASSMWGCSSGLSAFKFSCKSIS